jgi:hypothetical protein
MSADNMPPLPEAANDNRKHRRAGFHEPHGPAYSRDQMHAYARDYAAAQTRELVEACQTVLREYAEYAGLWKIDTESEGVAACRAAIAKHKGAAS